MRRVVITGMGTINPLGHNVKETFEAMIAGQNGIDKITHFDTTGFKATLAGEIKDLDLNNYFDPKDIKRNDKVNLFGLIAAEEAMKQANLNEGDFDPYRFGVFVTSGIGGLDTFYEEIATSITRGPSRISPFFIPKTIINMTGGAISIRFNLKGPNIPVVTACSASTNSIGEAFRNIKHGYIDLAIAGGSEAPINEIGVAGFQSIRALSFSEDKNKASIPFDFERNGFIMAEGAGTIILEEYEHAKARGAKILGEIIGYGTTNDAFHITAPDETGETIARAIQLALEEGHITTKDIDYINAHGTSTNLNDKTETKGIKVAFGDEAYKLNVSSTKSMMGHALGAAGVIEAIATIEALNNGIVPPTINLTTPDPELDLNYTPNHAIKRDLRYALTMNLGFGGHNAVLLFKKVGN